MGITATESDWTLYDVWRLYGDWKQFDPARHRGKINVLFADGHAETLGLPADRLRSYGVHSDIDQAGVTKGVYP
jgi:prepilin-type processing-associated H-X9-DG protein